MAERDRFKIHTRYINESSENTILSPDVDSLVVGRAQNFLFSLLNTMNLFSVETGARTRTYRDGMRIRIYVYGNNADIYYTLPEGAVEEIRYNTDMVSVRYSKQLPEHKIFYDFAEDSGENFFIKLPYAISKTIKYPLAFAVCEDLPECGALLYQTGPDVSGPTYTRELRILRFVASKVQKNVPKVGGYRERTFSYSISTGGNVSSYSVTGSGSLTGGGGTVSGTATAYFPFHEGAYTNGFTFGPVAWSYTINSDYTYQFQNTGPLVWSEELMSGLQYVWPTITAILSGGQTTVLSGISGTGTSFEPRGMVAWVTTSEPSPADIQWEVLGLMNVSLGGTVTSSQFTRYSGEGFASRWGATNNWGQPNPPYTPSYDVEGSWLNVVFSGTDIRAAGGSMIVPVKLTNGVFTGFPLVGPPTYTVTAFGGSFAITAHGQIHKIYEAAAVWNKTGTSFNWKVAYSKVSGSIETLYLYGDGTPGYSKSLIGTPWGPCMLSKGGGEPNRWAITVWPENGIGPNNKRFYVLDNVFMDDPGAVIPGTEDHGRYSREFQMAFNKYEMSKVAGVQAYGTWSDLGGLAISANFQGFHYDSPSVYGANYFSSIIDNNYLPAGLWAIGWGTLCDFSVIKRGALNHTSIIQV